MSQSLTGIPDFNVMQPTPEDMALEDTFASNFGFKISFGHRHSSSRRSSSTVESQSWNTEKQFEERPNGEYMLKRKACDSNLKNSRSPQTSGTDPTEMSDQEARELYPPQAFVQVGPEHGTSVHDFACVPAKTPVSDDSWANVRHAPSYHGSSDSFSGSSPDHSSPVDLGHRRTDT